MTSRRQNVYTWIWLAGETQPIVAGVIEKADGVLSFTYGKSYLGNPKAIPIFTPEIPLSMERIMPMAGLEMANCIRDCSPDAWGRRVILNRMYGNKYDANMDTGIEDEITYLIKSSSNRIGALDFQTSAKKYTPRQSKGATVDELMNAADIVNKGLPLTEELGEALLHGTAIGGARPKATLTDNKTQYIAKFSTADDTYNVVKSEYIAMKLAKLVGINVAEVELVEKMGRSILLVKRFDRIPIKSGWGRRNLVSTLTILGLSDSLARYASYEDIAGFIKQDFNSPKENLIELFRRMVFNVLVGNNDDHARNHAAFWDGEKLDLTPAYDICPQNRSSELATQAIKIMGNESQSQISLCIKAASIFNLSKEMAKNICKEQVKIIEDNWDKVCAEADLSEIDKRKLWKNQILNPYCFY